MAVPARAEDAPGGAVPRTASRWWPAVPATAAVVAGAALLLPWWRAGAGPVLVGGGPLGALAPDSWSGVEVAGWRAALVIVLALLAGVLAVAAAGVGARASAAAAGAAAATCGVAALLAWGPTGVAGPFLAVAAGAGAVVAGVAGRVRRPLVPAAVLVAAAVTVVVPGGEPVPDRGAARPFERVAALGSSWSTRSGAGGLDTGAGDPVLVVVDGAPGVAGAAGVVVADPRGRARVLARVEAGAPPPLGVVGGRMVRPVRADALAVTGLVADGPLDVVVRDVAAAGRLGDDGAVWLRSTLDPPGTVRRLDLAAHAGRQELSATFLPVVTIRGPDGEPPLDVAAVRPVPGGALRLDDTGAGRRLQLLTVTPAGVAVRTLLDTSAPACDGTAITAFSDVRIVAADGTGVWFSTSDRRLAHRAPDGTVRTVPARLPGLLAALAAPGDGSVLFVARDDRGEALWRLPDAVAALTEPPC